MKALLLAGAAGILAGGPAFAAPPAPAVAPALSYSWTGCYVGGHIGGGWGQKDLTSFAFLEGGPPAPADISGWLGGGQIGCNVQFATNWVAGIEVADSWANLRGASDPFFDGKTFHAQTNWIASGAVRVGYAWDRWLVYAKGGPAWAGDKYSVLGTFDGEIFTNLQGSETRSGWTLGGGVEWAFWQNWSADLDYAYYAFGSRSLALSGFVGGEGGSLPATIKQNVQTVTLGVNYHF